MAEGFKSIVIGVFIVSLFAFLLIFFAMRMGTEYDQPTDELSGGKLNFTQINKTMYGVSDLTDDVQESFGEQRNWAVAGIIAVTGIFKLAFQTIWAIIKIPFIVVGQIFENVFHIPQVATNVMMLIFVISVVLGIWRLMKIGE